MVERMRAGWTWGWQFDGACRGEDSSLFFAPSYFEKREEKAAREVKAKAICTGCPVREPCLDYALRIRGAARHLGRSERVRAASTPPPGGPPGGLGTPDPFLPPSHRFWPSPAGGSAIREAESRRRRWSP